MRIVTIVGARPQFVKAAAVARAVAHRRRDGVPIDHRLVHTGQHFDANMSDVFFAELEIPAPDRHLGISGGGHGAMTGRMLAELEAVLEAERPDRVLVYGDTNSTLAGALAAVKLHVPVAHVEAGLRSFNRRMPEEINRIVADGIADRLYAPTDAAVANLRREGVAEERIRRVGDVMYDVVLHLRARIEDDRTTLDRFGLEPRGYALATVHRAENTDDPARLREIVAGLDAIGRRLPVVCPLHPRTRAALARDGLAPGAGVRLVDPIGYLGMAALEMHAALIATDSGGVQKEAFFHGVPCLTLRDETEWVELVEIGANRLVGADRDRIGAGFDAALGSVVPRDELYGRGDTAERIVEDLLAGAAPALTASEPQPYHPG